MCMCAWVYTYIHVSTCACVRESMHVHTRIPACWNQGWSWHLPNQRTGISRRRTQTQRQPVVCFCRLITPIRRSLGTPSAARETKSEFPAWQCEITLCQSVDVHICINTAACLYWSRQASCFVPLVEKACCHCGCFGTGARRTGRRGGVIDPKKQGPKTLLLATLQSWMIAALILWKCFSNRERSIFKHCP